MFHYCATNCPLLGQIKRMIGYYLKCCLRQTQRGRWNKKSFAVTGSETTCMMSFKLVYTEHVAKAACQQNVSSSCRPLSVLTMALSSHSVVYTSFLSRHYNLYTCGCVSFTTQVLLREFEMEH